VRGSSRYGKTFLKLNDGYKRVDAYKDIGSLLDWIAKDESLDTERVVVTGFSYGAHMSLVAETRYPDRIRCAVDAAGIANLRTFLENTEGYRHDLRRGARCICSDMGIELRRAEQKLHDALIHL
jgi:dipeptidyl aminopeptidase/acylaminoacyl peptidase